jgi:hypothetical protein
MRSGFLCQIPRLPLTIAIGRTISHNKKRMIIMEEIILGKKTEDRIASILKSIVAIVPYAGHILSELVGNLIPINWHCTVRDIGNVANTLS